MELEVIKQVDWEEKRLEARKPYRQKTRALTKSGEVAAAQGCSQSPGWWVYSRVLTEPRVVGLLKGAHRAWGGGAAQGCSSSRLQLSR